MHAIGFDIGGTKIEASLVRFEENPHADAACALGSAVARASTSVTFPYQNRAGRRFLGTIVSRSRVPTERHLGYEPIVAKMARLVDRVCEEGGVGPASLAGVGLAIPGAVDPRSLRMLNGNTLVLKGRDLAGDLRAALSRPTLRVAAENDANCFALGEALCGAGAAHAAERGLTVRDIVVVGIILGTGCGGGVVVGGDTLRGTRGGAGEFGHVPLRENGLMCWCGKRGCAEQYLAGSGLEQHFNGRLYSQSSTPQPARAIFELAAGGDPVALACVKAHKEDLVTFLGRLATIFDPDLFVLGGGVSLQPSLYPGLSEAVAAQAFLPGSSAPVKQHLLGDSAGVVGASLLVVKDL